MNKAARILVIDDNQAIHQDFRKIFGASGPRQAPSMAERALLGDGAGSGGVPEFTLDSAYQGAEGLALVRLAQEQEQPYAMAFVDVRMPPGWDGIETTRRIWKHDPDIQVVICTAYSDYSWSEMLSSLGRSDRLVILKKPFDAIEVLQLASALSEKWRLARQSRSMVEELERKVVERTGELRHTVEGLRRSEGLKRAILESSLDCIITMDHEARIVEFNAAAEATFGVPCAQAIGRTVAETIIPPRLRDAHTHGLARYLATGESRVLGKRVELEAIRADGTEFPIELAITAIGGTSQPMFTGFIRDITARKAADSKIRRLNRVYAVLSAINTLIVRVSGRDELFREASRIAVEHGGFRMAWIGLVNRDARVIEPIASAGDVRDFFAAAPLAVNATEPGGHGLSGRAVRAGKPVISNDVRNDPQRMMRRELEERGINSLAVIPLVVGGEAIGVLALYAAEVGFFDDAEMRLLTELGEDISFAVAHLEKSAKLGRITRVNAMLSGINAAIVRIRDRDELFQEACRIALETGGMSFAWVGVADASGKQLQLVASAGRDDGFLQSIRDRLALRDAAPEAQGLGMRVFLEGRAVVVNDVAADPVINRRKAFADRGIKAIAVFPMSIAGRTVGTFALHSEQAGFFDGDELRLLHEMAANIAFALEHLEKEEKVRRLTRVHAMLSGINALIVRVHNRDELFRDACKIAVEQGAFPMAWIGIVDRNAMKIVPVASAGADAGFLTSARPWLSLTDDPPAGPGPSVIAVRTKQAVVVDEMDSDPRMRGGGAHLAPGVRSLLILPLLVGGEVFAVFGLHALEAGYFDDTEMKLLGELGGDIAFAIDHIDKQERLDYLAYYDALTGLANRRLFLERAAQYARSAAAEGHQLGLFLMDIERFRNINDSLGRAAGDALLKQVAHWLKIAVGDASLVGRMGADHFAVVLPRVKSGGSVARLVEKAMARLSNHPFQVGENVLRLASKVGAALFPEDGADADALLRNAEAALKKAKSTGDRYLFYTQAMTATVARALTMENQLREALEKEQFVLHYQPKVSLVDAKLTGVEALIRWSDPRTGLVPPGQFIPILEETGLIHDVGRWALRKAIEDYLRWRAAGLAAVRVAVNVSPLQLRDSGFIAEVERVIRVNPDAPAGLELEITEGVIMQDLKGSIASLQAIRDMGVTIAIDDFGTGFSSLSYLSKLPLDTLKIDRSFVVDMTSGPRGLALVSTIVGLAHSMNLKVVAEGVETEEQSKLLRLLRCDEMQGYLFSKPVPADIFEAKFLVPDASSRVPLPAAA